MKEAEEIFRGARCRSLLQFFEISAELRIDVLVIELVGLHDMAVGVDDLDAVEHPRACCGTRRAPAVRSILSRIEGA
jgi:hypothetical protein